MRIFSALIFLIIVSHSASASAQTCGDANAPCETASGIYHFAAPKEATSAPPAVIFLHGYGGTGAGVIRNKGLLKPVLERGYAVIAPQGLPLREGFRGGAWNSMLREGRRDDVGYLIDIASDAVARHGLDRDNILLAGFSGGGMMTWRVACDAPDAFAAYAPIAGLLWRPLPEDCVGPVKMHHTHGWSDPVVPIEGRSVAAGRFTQGDLFQGLDMIRRANSCLKDDPDEYADDGLYLTRTWANCDETAALSMVLHPGGHSIPKGWSIMALDWFEAVR